MNYLKPFSIICMLLFSQTSLFANGNESILEEIDAKLETSVDQIHPALGSLEKQLNKSLGHLTGIKKSFCNPGMDCDYNSGHGAVDDATESEIAIDYITGGWVTPETAPGNAAREQVCGLDADNEDTGVTCQFSTISYAEHAVFQDKLCLEVHFKDTTQMQYSNPIFTNKSFVLCAMVADGGELINLGCVDDRSGSGADIVDGKSCNDHLNVGLWQCFNPRDEFNNGGQAFGENLDTSDGKVKGLPLSDTLLKHCVTVASQDLNIDLGAGDNGDSSGDAGSGGNGGSQVSGGGDSGNYGAAYVPNLVTVNVDVQSLWSPSGTVKDLLKMPTCACDAYVIAEKLDDLSTRGNQCAGSGMLGYTYGTKPLEYFKELTGVRHDDAPKGSNDMTDDMRFYHNDPWGDDQYCIEESFFLKKICTTLYDGCDGEVGSSNTLTKQVDLMEDADGNNIFEMGLGVEANLDAYPDICTRIHPNDPTRVQNYTCPDGSYVP